MNRPARLIGVGVGPGDPELMTLKAVRALREADVVAHFAKAGRAGNARAIAAGHMTPGAVELPLRYPVTTEIPTSDPAYAIAIDTFFDLSAEAVASHLDQALAFGGVIHGVRAVFRCGAASYTAASASLRMPACRRTRHTRRVRWSVR